MVISSDGIITWSPEKTGLYENITVDIVKNPDVTGAGDTVISVLSF